MGDQVENRNQSWFGERIQGSDGAIKRPKTEGGLVKILRNQQQYPSPVRPVGSRHSMTPCIEAAAPNKPDSWGTIVDMTAMKTLRSGKTLEFGKTPDGNPTVTVPAGRRFIDVATEVAGQGFQFRVNTELGSLTMGAAACGATKDSSFPEEPGQVCSDVVGMRLIRPNGDPLDVKDGDPDFDALRCSYGLFGIVTEVTYRVFPHQNISIEHVPVDLEKFKSTSPEWLNNRNAVFLYLFPYWGWIVAELRKKLPGEGALPAPPWKSTRLLMRNHFWEKGMLEFEQAIGSVVQPAKIAAQEVSDVLLRVSLTLGLNLPQVSPVEQIVDFDKKDRAHRFTFSMWAFREQEFPDILTEYFKLCKGHMAICTSLPHVSYHISQDARSLLSYSHDGAVWTLDPVCREEDAKKDAWKVFLKEYNAFCSEHGGVPLFNQTPCLNREYVTRAFKGRLLDFEAARRRFDPQNRMLNAYFAKLLDS